MTADDGAGHEAQPFTRPLRRLAGETDRPGLGPLGFALLAILLGVLTGLGAYAFRILIALVHNAAFLGQLSISYDANAHTPGSPLGLGIVVVPALGGMVVVFLVKRFAPEAKGHGVPEVMDAIYYQKSEIRPIVAVIKSLASAISIGTGGSVGREGPIVQIGAAFGSASGLFGRVARWQRATLVAAGGGAGIAATFNTPIGGILFAVEVLMHEVSARTLVPVALAATTATYVAQSAFGDHPAFVVPAIEPSAGVAVLPAYVLLGCLTALASILFIRTLYGTEDFFDRAIPGRPYLRHAVGMLGVGIIITAMFRWQGHYYVQGVGYATVADVLTSPQSAAFLLLLFGLKLVVTSTTLGSGASGGVFSPSLFMGATLGAAFGITTELPGDPAIYALAGMAGMVAGVTGAVLTAIVMLFEMTLDYAVVLPMALTASVSYGLRRMLLNDSIYTMKLTRRGHVMPQALQANAHLIHHVSEMTMARVLVLPVSAPPGRLDLTDDGDTANYIVLCGDDDRISAVISREWARCHREALASAQRLGDLDPVPHTTVDAGTSIFDLLARMQASGTSVAVVCSASAQGPSTISGVVTKGDVAEALAEGMEMFGG